MRNDTTIQIKARAYPTTGLRIYFDAKITLTLLPVTNPIIGPEVEFTFFIEGVSLRSHIWYEELQDVSLRSGYTRFGYVFEIDSADSAVVAIWRDSVLLGL